MGEIRNAEDAEGNASRDVIEFEFPADGAEETIQALDPARKEMRDGQGDVPKRHDDTQEEAADGFADTDKEIEDRFGNPYLRREGFRSGLNRKGF